MPKKKIDRMALLKQLRKNARMSYTELAQKENSSVSSIYEHVTQIEKQYVQRHTSLIKFSQIGFPFRSIIIIQHVTEELQNYLEQNPHLNNCSTTRNGELITEFIFPSTLVREEELETLAEKTCVFKHYPILKILAQEIFIPN